MACRKHVCHPPQLLKFWPLHCLIQIISYVFLFVKPTLFPSLQGYIIPMDFIWLKHLIPDVLQNNKEFLFGNIRELYEFHNRYIMIQIIRENGK